MLQVNYRLGRGLTCMLFCCFFLSFATKAQINFTNLYQPTTEIVSPPFEKASGGVFEFADIDGDNDLDLLVIGDDQGVYCQCDTDGFLYKNDGNGKFTKVLNAPFQELFDAKITFGDIDGDNDQDILIAGRLRAGGAATQLFENDGAGNFTEIMDHGITSSEYSSTPAFFEDVDGDNDLDILISSGSDFSFNNEPTIYLNDGSGAFTQASNFTFSSLDASALALVDIDGDGQKELFFAGRDDSFNDVVRFYTNDGSGNFMEGPLNPFSEFETVRSATFADYDGDGDQDAIVLGDQPTAGFNLEMAMYLNNGGGSFTQLTILGTNLSRVVTVGDYDGDSDVDVVMHHGDDNTNILYINDGNAVLTQATKQLPLHDVPWFQGNLVDVDGDSDLDLMLSTFGSTLSLYANDGQGQFLRASGDFFDGVWFSHLDFADIDGDHDLDAVVSGSTNESKARTKIYINQGTNMPFAEREIVQKNGTVHFDANHQNNLYVAGIDGIYYYTNDGSGNYTEAAITAYPGVTQGDAAFADVNNDQYPDVLVAGFSSQQSPSRIAKLYMNDGNGAFTEVMNTPFNGVVNPAVTFEDVDMDNDLDVVIAGFNQNTALYLNDGLGNFTRDFSVSFGGSYNQGAIAFADVDRDGDPDMLMTGQVSGLSTAVTKLYLNDGQGGFTEKGTHGLEQMTWGDAKFADVDRDGDPDVLLTGNVGELSNTPVAFLYENDGSGNFTFVPDMPFEGARGGDIAFVDLDQDNDLDVFITGIDRAFRFRALGYENNSIAVCQDTDSSFTVTACDSYTSPSGKIWTMNGVYKDTILNQLSCDSLITIDLTLKQSSSHSFAVTACNWYTSPSGKQWNSSGIYMDTIPNSSGCDSILTIDATINQFTASSFGVTACDSYTSPSGKIWTSTGVFMDTIPNAVGCDSVLIISTQIKKSTAFRFDEIACDRYTSPSGKIWTSSGSYQDTIPNAVGCDSVLTIDLTIEESTSHSFAVTACDSYTSPSGKIWMESDLYMDTIPNILGCDSILTIDLTINVVDTAVTVNGMTLTASASNATYQWLDCTDNYAPIAGATAQSYTATIPKNYAVAVTQNNCTDTSACFTIYAVGLANELPIQNVYPNPTNGLFTVDLGDAYAQVSYQLYNSAGQLLGANKQSNTNRLTLDISQQNQGMYYLKITADNLQKVIKISRGE